MKKTLTKNITRYDNKMVFRFDKKTILSTIKSACFGAVIAFLLYFVIGLIFAVFIGVLVGAILLVIQIAVTDGITLKDYLKRMIIIMIDPKSRKKPYQMRNDDLYRICVLTSQEQKKKGEANEGKRKKGSREAF